MIVTARQHYLQARFKPSAFAESLAGVFFPSCHGGQPSADNLLTVQFPNDPRSNRTQAIYCSQEFPGTFCQEWCILTGIDNSCFHGHWKFINGNIQRMSLIYFIGSRKCGISSSVIQIPFHRMPRMWTLPQSTCFCWNLIQDHHPLLVHTFALYAIHKFLIICKHNLRYF